MGLLIAKLGRHLGKRLWWRRGRVGVFWIVIELLLMRRMKYLRLWESHLLYLRMIAMRGLWWYVIQMVHLRLWLYWILIRHVMTVWSRRWIELRHVLWRHTWDDYHGLPSLLRWWMLLLLIISILLLYRSAILVLPVLTVPLVVHAEICSYASPWSTFHYYLVRATNDYCELVVHSVHVCSFTVSL